MTHRQTFLNVINILNLHNEFLYIEYLSNRAFHLTLMTTPETVKVEMESFYFIPLCKELYFLWN